MLKSTTSKYIGTKVCDVNAHHSCLQRISCVQIVENRKALRNRFHHAQINYIKMYVPILKPNQKTSPGSKKYGLILGVSSYRN